MEERFEAYIQRLSSVLQHADRVEPFRAYTQGLLLPGKRKSIEPIAARMFPQKVSAAHQCLHHFVTQADWDQDKLLSAVIEYVLPKMQAQEPLVAWIVDDTGFPKKGTHSVGVARQYCGQIGKQDNCQVTVSVSVANHHSSLPVAFRLYLPESWAKDPEKRKQAGVPEQIGFQTKSQIALDQLRALHNSQLPHGVVLADAAYGNESAFRQAVRDLELSYALGILKNTKVFRKGEGPLPPKPYSGSRRRPKLLQPNPQQASLSVLDVAQKLSEADYQMVSYREGTHKELSSRFARLRVREAHRYYNRSELPPEEWLLIEWPQGEDEPTKYWLSNLPQDISLEALVEVAKLRFRVERDYQELKQEIGLGHFEGRGWRGFHHHSALCIAAYGFLVAERSAFPPSAPGPQPGFRSPKIPAGYRPRGSANSNRKAHGALHQDAAKAVGRSLGSHPLSVSVLPSKKQLSKSTIYEIQFMT